VKNGATLWPSVWLAASNTGERARRRWNAIAYEIGKLYNPAAFGILALYVSIATILGAVACGRYELAIMLPKKDREAANLFWLSTAITFATSTLIFLAVVLTGEAIESDLICR